MNNKAVLFGIMGLIVGSFITYIFISNTGNKAVDTTTQTQQAMNNMDMGNMGTSMTMSGDNMMAQLKGKTGAEFDKAFMNAMIEHHSSAISMAKEAQKNAGKEEIKKLAEDIIVAQTKEIEMMKQWQQIWGY